MPKWSRITTLRQFCDAEESAKYVLVFDLDGTLVDTLPSMSNAMNHLLNEINLFVEPSELKKYYDGNIKLYLKHYLSHTKNKNEDLVKYSNQFENIYCAQFVSNSKLYPNVQETLDLLIENNHTLALCTNLPTRSTQQILQYHSLTKYFKAIVCGDTLPVMKPNPGPLLQAIELSSTQEQTCIMIGDDESDEKAAAAAGVPFIAVSYGYASNPFISASFELKDISELPGALVHLTEKSMY